MGVVWRLKRVVGVVVVVVVVGSGGSRRGCGGGDIESKLRNP